LKKDITVVVTSDWHSNFKYGLMNPKVVVYDEDEEGNLTPYTPEPTATQKYLWGLYEQVINEVKEYSKGTEIILFSLGELTHGNHFGNELVSTRQSDQIIMALSNFDPWMELKNLTTIRLATGTEVHEFGEGSSAHLVADTLSKEHTKLDIKAVNHGLYSIGNITIDFAHHGPGASQRIWLEGNTALYYLRDRMMKDIIKGNKPPDVYLRGHVHTPVNVITSIRQHESRLVICPSMCVMSGFARKITRSSPEVTNGIVLFRITKGTEISKPVFLTETLDLRTKENYK
jgi:hypothetical protein